MSFEAAAWAINRRTRTATAKLVLIGLADCHNRDTGECNPGNTYLARIAQCTNRSVINAIEELSELGYLSAAKSNGRRTNYLLHLNKTGETSFTGENSSPVKSVHKPVKSETPTGENDNTPFSIEPVRTSNKTSSGEAPPRPPDKPRKSSVLDFSSWPTAPDPQILSDWKKTRKAVLTQTAVDRMGDQLHEAVRHGYSVDHCLGVCCEAGWRGFNFQWLLNRLQNHGGPRHGSTQPANPFTDESDWLDEGTYQRAVQAAEWHQAGMAGGVPGSGSHSGGEGPVADGVGGGGHFGLEHHRARLG